MTYVKKTFEQWLQQFNSYLHIEQITNEVIDDDGEVIGRKVNQDVDTLYFGKKRLCTVPKGLKRAKDWNISDKRGDAGYRTSDNIAHRSLSGIGTYLLMNKIITPIQFMDHFLTPRNKEALQKIINRGTFKQKGFHISL